MSLPEKDNTEDVDSLVNTLDMESATLSENNISLSRTDLQRLAELSQELSLSNAMETEETEEVIIEQTGDIREEIVETEIGAEEIEIETEERQPSPEEILPDIKTKTTVPPLRPLTIAPKPAKVPITLKPLAGGQQLLLVQGQSLSTGSGQTIKLLSPQGQELNIANLQLGRPIKPANTVKTISATSAGNISVVPQKQLFVKKVVSAGGITKNVVKPVYNTKQPQGQHFMVVQKAEPNATTHVKLVPSTGSLTQIGPTKTITLQQAQEMGLLTNAKFVPQTQAAPKTTTLLLNKSSSKTLKLVPRVGGQTHHIVSTAAGGAKAITLNPVKTPTKILPAQKVPQQILYKKPIAGQSILPQAQVIQVASGQTLNANQLHQINIPGKGVQYIKFVPSTTVASVPTSTVTVSTAATKPNLSLHTTPGGSLVLSELGSSNHSNQKNVKPCVINKPVTVNTQVVMLPYLSTTQANPPPAKVAIPKHNPRPISSSSSSASTPETQSRPPPQPPLDPGLDANGMRTRKPCNCTKSQCLKLYCDCFANGEFCYQCKCMSCYNNLENEEYRQRAIKTCLERNPNAFRPKIGKAKDMAGDSSIRKHTKGCNCKRSGCLKNYCECYEAKIACSSNCKCIGCRNIEDSLERKNFRSVVNNGVTIVPLERLVPKTNNNVPLTKPKLMHTGRQAVSFITDDVIEATCQCLISVADKGTENMQDVETTTREIIEEFGRCLNEIIECSTNRSP